MCFTYVFYALPALKIKNKMFKHSPFILIITKAGTVSRCWNTPSTDWTMEFPASAFLLDIDKGKMKKSKKQIYFFL